MSDVVSVSSRSVLMIFLHPSPASDDTVNGHAYSDGATFAPPDVANGRFVDPMKIRLPSGRVLEGALLAGFDHERSRLDALVSDAR